MTRSFALLVFLLIVAVAGQATAQAPLNAGDIAAAREALAQDLKTPMGRLGLDRFAREYLRVRTEQAPLGYEKSLPSFIPQSRQAYEALSRRLLNMQTPISLPASPGRPVERLLQALRDNAAKEPQWIAKFKQASDVFRRLDDRTLVFAMAEMAWAYIELGGEFTAVLEGFTGYYPFCVR